MTGWQWCSGAYGQCSTCKSFVTGLWRFFVTETRSTLNVCASCAEDA